MKVHIETSDTLDAGQLGVMRLGATLTADVTCQIDNGPTWVELVTTYNPIPSTDQPSSIFVGSNTTSKASLYWGQSLLRLYWVDVLKSYYEENESQDVPYYKASVTLTRAGSTAATATDKTDTDFLSVQACWLTPLNSTGIAHTASFCDSNLISVLAEGNTTQKPVPSMWKSMGWLGKAMWFTVLADVGRDDDLQPNMLARPDLLENLSANMSTVNASLPSSWRWGLQSASRSLESYVAADDGTDQLGVSPAVLSTNYICQVPKLKTTGALIMSVLVADLVPLQGIWKLYLLAVDYFWVSKSDNLKYCVGCALLNQQGDQGAIPLLESKSPWRTSGHDEDDGISSMLVNQRRRLE